MSVVYRKLNKTTVDVFYGTGWDNWSRFEKTPHGIKLVKGLPVAPEQFRKVKDVLSMGNADKRKKELLHVRNPNF